MVDRHRIEDEFGDHLLVRDLLFALSFVAVNAVSWKFVTGASWAWGLRFGVLVGAGFFAVMEAYSRQTGATSMFRSFGEDPLE